MGQPSLFISFLINSITKTRENIYLFVDDVSTHTEEYLPLFILHNRNISCILYCIIIYNQCNYSSTNNKSICQSTFLVSYFSIISIQQFMHPFSYQDQHQLQYHSNFNCRRNKQWYIRKHLRIITYKCEWIEKSTKPPFDKSIFYDSKQCIELALQHNVYHLVYLMGNRSNVASNLVIVSPFIIILFIEFLLYTVCVILNQYLEIIRDGKNITTYISN